MNNKVYVVTGATSGIGKALVKVLSENNTVFASYRSENKKQELSAISGNIIPFYVDYANAQTVYQAVCEIKSKCKKIDTLVNIAGCVVAGPIEKIKISVIRRQFDVNAFGHIHLTQGLLDIMDGGKIINISSMASFGIFPFISPYCASKRCLDMFFNSLLIENKRGIKVVSIKPGVIATPLWCKSVDENTKQLDDCETYEREMNFIMSNAQKNQTGGLDINKVIEIILKADNAKNPKLSYTVGKDAFFAQIFSLLPQCIINYFVKLGLKARMK